MDTYFYYYNHQNQNQYSGDCSCSCFTCLYKLDLILILVVIYLLLMDKITINIQSAGGSTGQLPLVPVDVGNSNNAESSSPKSDNLICDDQPLESSESPESLAESVNSSSSTSTSTTTSWSRKLIKPDISLDFLYLSDDDNHDNNDDDDEDAEDGDREDVDVKDDGQESESDGNYCQDNLCAEELFSNGFLSSHQLKSNSSKCLHVKRQSSLDSDTLTWDSSSSVSSSSSFSPLSSPSLVQQHQQLYSSLPCNLIDNIYVHEAMEVDLPFNLSLTFTELGHIRKALAREELDSMSFCHSVREQLVRGKLCSTCLKTRFKLFGPWADCCRLCERPVCSRCSTNVQINAKRYNSIPIQLLVPNKSYRKSLSSSPSSSSTTSPSPSTFAKIETTAGRQNSSSPLSFTSSSASQNGPSFVPSKPFSHWKRSKGSFTRSLPWIRRTVSSKAVEDGDEKDEGDEADDDSKANNLSNMVIKLCLDCELFFVSLLAN